jgi:hypothetical protein
MATKKVNIDIVAKDKSKQALNNVNNNLERTKRSVLNVKNALIGLGAGLAIRSIVQTGIQIEGLQVRLKALFGSVEEGARAFNVMAEFAGKVPFSLEEIQRGAGNLAVVSDDAEQLGEILKITGNVAAATGLDFETTATQIQRAFSGGIASADIFRERGVRDMLGFSAGAKVSVQETIEAFQRVFGPGGEFGSVTDDLAKTFEGTLSMLNDKVFNFKRIIVQEGFFPELKRQFGDLDDFIEDNQASIDAFAKSLGSGLGLAVDRLGDGFKFVKDNADILLEIFKLIIALKIAGFFINASIAAMKFAKSMIAVALGSQAVSKGLAGLGAAILKGGAVFVAFNQLDKFFDGFIKDLNDSANAIGNTEDEYLKASDAIGSASKKSEDAIKGVTLAGDGTIDMLKEMQKVVDDNAKAFERINERGMSPLDQIENNMLKELKLVQDTMDALEHIRLEKITRGILSEKEANKEFAEETFKLEQLKLKIIKDAAKLEEEFLRNKREQELKDQQAHFDKQFRLIKSFRMEDLELNKLSDENKKQLAIQTGREALDQLSRHNRTLFQINKALAIKDAIVSTAQGVTKALGMGPFGIPLALGIGALGAAQVATIAQTQYTGRRAGGPVQKDKPFIVGEQGPELFVPNQAGAIQPNGNTGVNINFNINTVDARGFNELLVNSRGTIVNMINNAVNEKGKMAII